MELAAMWYIIGRQAQAEQKYSTNDCFITYRVQGVQKSRVRDSIPAWPWRLQLFRSGSANSSSACPTSSWRGETDMSYPRIGIYTNQKGAVPLRVLYLISKWACLLLVSGFKILSGFLIRPSPRGYGRETYWNTCAQEKKRQG